MILPKSKISISCLALILIVLSSGRGDGHLRGSVIPSEDGKTYLSVVDDNGGKCGPILVDGEIWEYELNEAGQISPGTHIIECGTKIEFKIPDSVVFRFDYWGP